VHAGEPAQLALGDRVGHAELEVLVEHDLGDHHLEDDLTRHDVDALQDVDDQLVVALRREDDERVRHLVGDDADFFLEDAGRSRGAAAGRAGGAGLSALKPARQRDAEHLSLLSLLPRGAGLAADAALLAARETAATTAYSSRTLLAGAERSAARALDRGGVRVASRAREPTAEPAAPVAAGAADAAAPVLAAEPALSTLRAARAEEPDAAGLAARIAADAATAARPALAAEELVQHGCEVGRLRVLDVVDERLPPRRLV